MSLLGSKFIFGTLSGFFMFYFFFNFIIWFGYVNYSYFSVFLIILCEPLSVGNTDLKNYDLF